MSNLSIEQKLTMSLDEIMIEELKEKIVKLEKKCDKQMFKNDILVAKNVLVIYLIISAVS